MEATCLQQPQQLDRAGHGWVTDLVEKQRATVDCLALAFEDVAGAVVGARVHAELLGLGGIPQLSATSGPSPSAELAGMISLIFSLPPQVVIALERMAFAPLMCMVPARIAPVGREPEQIGDGGHQPMTVPRLAPVVGGAQADPVPRRFQMRPCGQQHDWNIGMARVNLQEQ